ncbi:MAG: hypothetical protein M1826_004593 [Phylliscum demangeonii]|nr:MAG: hypothetical protein M1826_004593 [Phylliscum demangeonii]
MASSKALLSTRLPPLICGTATFTAQYNQDPWKLPTTEIVHRALAGGITAFDTSPYYSPAEKLLGAALDTPFVRQNFAREDYLLLTKVGRKTASDFDYSPSWIRLSIERSLHHLRTTYLDVVYCHDVEFVSKEEALAGVEELRRIRDESGTIRYIGISGYPIALLCDLAETVLRTTGEPLDAVMSYANFTLQNTLLGSDGVPRLRAAGVDVVLNASPLAMGLLRSEGVPVGSRGDFHPAADGLRKACLRASDRCDREGEKLEVIALRYALEHWLQQGRVVGSSGIPPSGRSPRSETTHASPYGKLGVSVIGVSRLEELDETMRVWQSILDGVDDGQRVIGGVGDGGHERSLRRRERTNELAIAVRTALGLWVNYAWPSPGASYLDMKRTSMEAPSSLPLPSLMGHL